LGRKHSQWAKAAPRSPAALAAGECHWRWLYNAHMDEIAAVHGVDPITAIRIKAATYLGTKLGEMSSERPKIDSPASAAALVQHEMGMLE